VDVRGGGKLLPVSLEFLALARVQEQEQGQLPLAQVRGAQPLLRLEEQAVERVALIAVAPAFLRLIVGVDKVANRLQRRIRALPEQRVQLLLGGRDVHERVEKLSFHILPSKRKIYRTTTAVHCQYMLHRWEIIHKISVASAQYCAPERHKKSGLAGREMVEWEDKI